MATGKKPGPHPEHPKDYMLRVRIDKITTEKLEQCAKLLGTTKSDVIRKGIDMVEEDLKK